MEIKQNRANPAVYTKLREHALTLPLPAKEGRTVLMLVMDWSLPSGLASVVAAFDGSASIYLSSGGGFIGGGPGSTDIRTAAAYAIKLAEQSIALFAPVSTADLPERGTVYLYARTSTGLLRGVASEKRLSERTDPLKSVGGAMQNVITQYRLFQAQKAQPKKSS